MKEAIWVNQGLLALVGGTLVFGLAMLQPLTVSARGCERDNECKGDRICNNGKCVDPVPAAAAIPVPGATPAVQPQDLAPAATYPVSPEETVPPQATPMATMAPQTVPVQIAGAPGYVVRVVEPEGVTAQCTTPCVLMTTPGQHTVEVQELLTQTIEVPNRPSEATLSTRKTGRAITSGIFAGMGAATAVAGLILAQEGNNQGHRDGQIYDWGYPFLVAGLVACGAGVYGLVTSLRSRDELSIKQHANAESPRSTLAVGVVPRRDGGALLTAGSTF